MLRNFCARFKIAVAIIALLQTILLSSHAVKIDVYVGHPPGVIKGLCILITLQDSHLMRGAERACSC